LHEGTAALCILPPGADEKPGAADGRGKTYRVILQAANGTVHLWADAGDWKTIEADLANALVGEGMAVAPFVVVFADPKGLTRRARIKANWLQLARFGMSQEKFEKACRQALSQGPVADAHKVLIDTGSHRDMPLTEMAQVDIVSAGQPQPATRPDAKSLPPATQPAAVDLDETVGLLAARVGGEWRRGKEHDGSEVIQGHIPSERDQTGGAYVLHPFAFDRAGQARLVKCRGDNPSLVRVIGAGSGWTLVDHELKGVPVAKANAARRIRHQLQLRPFNISVQWTLAAMEWHRGNLGKVGIQILLRTAGLKSGGFLNLALLPPDKIKDFPPKSNWRIAPISPEQVERILDYIVQEDLFEGPLVDRESADIDAPRPVYVLRFTDGPPRPPYSLGPALPMLRWLDGLRATLDGDAAKAMDELLKKLEPHRRAWGVAAPPAMPAETRPAPANTRPEAQTGEVPGRRPWVALLLAEADELRKAKPEQWSQWDDAVDGVVARYAAMVRNWRSRRPPPPPDVTPLKLPLPYLVSRCQSVRDRNMCLDAIAGNPDERRIDVLLALLRWSNRRGDLLVRAMLADRVESVVRGLLAASPQFASSAPPLSDEPLPSLLHAFGERLSPATRKAGYDWIRAAWSRAGRKLPGELRETLFRLDPDRAGGQPGVHDSGGVPP